MKLYVKVNANVFSCVLMMHWCKSFAAVYLTCAATTLPAVMLRYEIQFAVFCNQFSCEADAIGVLLLVLLLAKGGCWLTASALPQGKSFSLHIWIEKERKKHLGCFFYFFFFLVGWLHHALYMDSNLLFYYFFDRLSLQGSIIALAINHTSHLYMQ